jgi:hypothetical protein
MPLREPVIVECFVTVHVLKWRNNQTIRRQ